MTDTPRPFTMIQIGSLLVLPSGEVAISVYAPSNGCDDCIGSMRTETGRMCNHLPIGCGSGQYVWKPHDPKSTLAVVWAAHQALETLENY
jgi:hypothetical protein